MIEIAICDDSEHAWKDVEKHLLKYSLENEFDYRIDEYESGEELLCSGKKYDMVFMDYEFENKGKDGITISRALRHTDPDVTIVFLSGYPEAVFSSFEVAAFRFLLKPIDDGKFNETMDSFLTSMNKDRILNVHSPGNYHYVNENKILYVEGHGKRSIIHLGTHSDDIECSETLASVENRVDSLTFYRCHKSFLINMRHVKGYNYNCVTLDNGEAVLISRRKYRQFVERYADFIAEQV